MCKYTASNQGSELLSSLDARWSAGRATGADSYTSRHRRCVVVTRNRKFEEVGLDTDELLRFGK